MLNETIVTGKSSLFIFLILLFCIPVLALGQGQNPSPMTDTARPHDRIDPKEVKDKPFGITGLFAKPVKVFLPQGNLQTDSLRLLIHFHGEAYIPMHAVKHAEKPYVLANIHLGTGSSVYETALSKEKHLGVIVQSIRDSLSAVTSRKKKFSKIYLSAFSAGYGAVRAILKQRDASALIEGILLLDGLHTDYMPEQKVLARGGQLNEKKLAPFLQFARLAINKKKQFLITHSAIFPGTFASTTETADYLIRETGLQRNTVLKWGVLGMQQVSEVQKGNFKVMGFAGNSAPDHIDHFHAMYDFIRYFD